MAKLHTFHVSHYPCDLVLFTSSNKKAFLKKLRKLYKEKEYDFEFEGGLESCNGLTINFTDFLNVVAIWLPKKPTTLKELSILNHEILHAVCAVMSILDCKLDNNSEELYAYLTDYISLKCYEALGLKIS